MTGWDTADALERLLDLLLRYHPAPGRVLEGAMEPPTVEDLVKEARGERAEARDLAVVGLAVEGAGLPQDVLEEMAPLEAALEAAGGWRGICAAVPRFKEFYPGAWDAVMDHAAVVRIGGEGGLPHGQGWSPGAGCGAVQGEPGNSDPVEAAVPVWPGPGGPGGAGFLTP